MSDFKLEFTLKQHTPIIHFQSDQKGATLRTTELKPKLDRFLISQVFDNDTEKYKAFLVSGKEAALDYKVTISEDISMATEINDRNPLFFGNMGDGEDKKFKLNPNKTKVIFFSYKKELLSVLKKYFEAFLANTNFGTRQSKGFGSFYLTKPFEKSLIPHKVYSFKVNINNYDERIKLFYSFLRQGINLPNREGTRFYAKPAIFLYAQKEGMTWDKKAIKEKYFNNVLSNQQDEHTEINNCVNYDSQERYLLRDLFGLSSSQEWKIPYRDTILKEDNEKGKDNKPLLQRFKSPITFKPISDGNQMTVYFWANESISDMLNKKFKINTKHQKGLVLSTPSIFSFDAFFNFAFNIDLSKHIDAEYQGEKEFSFLQSMINDIKESK